MTRRRAPARHADRWMVSWADFLTLLFALFVLLFASAHGDGERARVMAASVRRAMGDTRPQPAAPVAPPAPAPATAPDLVSASDYLKRELSEEIDSGRMLVASDPRGVVITLRDEGFFASGADTLYPAAVASLSKVAGVIRGIPNSVLLEGHTDSTPIHGGRFRSNWELSSARSVAVLDLFVSKFEIPADRFGIAGYADNRPVDANESAEGRSHNRRVDIVIWSLPRENGAGKTGDSVR